MTKIFTTFYSESNNKEILFNSLKFKVLDLKAFGSFPTFNDFSK